MYSKVILCGYLGRDPEMRYTPAGVAVCSFSIATSRKWNNQDGSPSKETVWWKVTTWRKLAETCNQYLAKGRLVLVEARIQPNEHGNPRTYQRKDGTWAASYEITATTVKFLGGTNRNGGSENGSERQQQTQAAPEPPQRFVEENQIPF